MPGTAERPKIADKNDPRYFSIKTRAVRALKVKAADGETDRYLIQGTASSSVEDRYGDTLTESCQASMLSQAQGLTMWLNHSYDVPEDIAGTCVDPTLSRATADDGTSCLDLLITLEIDPQNPRAMKSWQHVNRGTKLAFSIGGYFTDFDFVDEDDWWFSPLIVNDIELLEISLVGIPANPRAYTKAFEVATEALRAEVVKRAEASVQEGTEARAARALVRKSFGFAEEIQPMDPEIKTASATDPADPPAEVTDPADADTLNAKRAAVKAVEDQAQQGALVECMKAIKSSLTHGMCTESATHNRTAHAVLSALLPDGYDIPEDAQLDDSTTKAADLTIAVKLDVDVSEAQAQVEQLTAKLAELQTTHDNLSAETAKLEAAKSELEQQIADLKATPTGRSTKSHLGGSSNESEPTASADLYYKPKSELMRSALTQTGATDARQTLQV